MHCTAFRAVEYRKTVIACDAVVYEHHLTSSGKETVQYGFFAAVYGQAPTDAKFASLNFP